MPSKISKAQKFRELQDKYVTQLPRRLSELKNAWEKTLNSHFETEQRDSFYRQLHNLSGSAATFGFVRLGQQSKYLDHKLLSLQDVDVFDAEDIDEIARSIVELEKIAALGPENRIVSPSVNAAPAKTKKGKEWLVYVLEDKLSLSDKFIRHLNRAGYQTVTFSTIDEIIQALERCLPAALILDIDLELGTLTGYQIVEKIHSMINNSVPTVSISANGNWKTKLAAVRAGCQIYMVKPIDFSALVVHLDALLERKPLVPYRILIVENNDLLAQHYAMVLSENGMQVQILLQPHRLLQILPTFDPELILMDIYMEECSGTEAAQVIRYSSQFDHIQLVYLSTENVLDQLLNALDLGGDDFLQKPISDSHLVSTIKAKVNRTRKLRRLMPQDK